MVQVYYDKGHPWDAHTDILKHRVNAKDSDQAFATVVKDLKSRGLLDETIVFCGTEFGRTPVVEIGGGGGGAAKNGRDHNPFGFSVWLAGGGFKGGCHTGRRMISASKRSRTRFTCTICTRRFCARWASITRS